MPQSRSAGVFIRWLLLFIALWTIISGADGWGFGIPASLVAAFWAWRQPLTWPALHCRYLPGFVAYFLLKLAVGAWDVAWRIVHPQLPINPAWQPYPLQSDNARVHLMLSALANLLPGTLATHFDKDILYLHILDQTQPWEHTVARLEWHLEQLLGERA